MTPFQQRLLAAVRAAGPDGIDGAALWERFYGGVGDHRMRCPHDHAPARSALKAMIWRVNQSLSGAGRIVGRNGSTYRFEKMAEKGRVS
jgi:hypothetical protein